VATNSFDIAVVPDDGISLTPDDELAALADIQTVDADAVFDDAEPLGRSWNFNANLLGTATQWVHGTESVYVWASIVLQIERYAFPILDEDVGMEDNAGIIGQVDAPGRHSQAEYDITEALMVHDRITGVGDFVWETRDEVLLMSATLEIDGDEEIQLTDIPVGMER